MSGIAVINSSADSIHIVGNADFSPLDLTVSEPGLYLVFARVVLQNDEGDSQNAGARVVHTAGDQTHFKEFVIDRVNVIIPGHARTSISLQGTLQVVPAAPTVPTTVVNLVCATFSGTASQSSIFAVQVSDFKFS
jgi:hypothetical protein